MDDFSARQALDLYGAEHRASALLANAASFDADDPLGDEAAFPMSWQHLAPADALRD